jgi:hypothetical protein
VAPVPFPRLASLPADRTLGSRHLHGVVKTARVSSTVGGLALTGLNRGLGPHHWVNRGRWREKKKTNPVRSRWSPALYKRRWPSRQWGSPLDHGTNSMDHSRERPSCHPPCRLLPSLLLRRRCHHQQKLACRAPVRRRIWWVRAATGSSGSLPTSPPQLAKVVCPDLGTQRPGQAIERWWWKGSGAKVDEANGYGSTPNEVTGDQASGGVRGGVADPVMVDPSTQMRTTEHMELVRARAVDKRGGVRFGLTLTALSPRPPFILSTQTLSHRGPPGWATPYGVWPGPRALVGSPNW